MKNGQLFAARKVLEQNGADLPDGVIMDLIAAVEVSEAVIFEPGDFVIMYEGMGESSYGTVKRRKGDGYVVEMFDYNGLWPSYKRESLRRNSMQLSSPEEAMEEFRLRGGISEAEYEARK